MSVIDTLAGSGRQQPKNAEFIAIMDDPASAALIERFVQETLIPHAFVRQGSVADLIALLTAMERPPRQLIVDLSTSTMPLSDLANLADVCPPGVSVVAVGQRNDIGLFRELLRIGVDDYLVKPLTMDLLRRVLARQSGKSEPVHHVRTGKVVACLGARGGVGTSMVAANLGWRLAEGLERRVALVDLDPFGGPLDLLLGAQPNRGLSDLLKNINRLDPQYVERSFMRVGPRLFLLAAGLGLDEDGTFPIDPLAQLLGELKKLFHYVILDIPVRGGELTATLAGGAETVVVVTESSVFATRETMRLIQLAEMRDAKAPLILAVNQPHQAGRAELRLADFEEAIGRKVGHVLPFDRDAASRAENLGPPVVAGTGPLAQALRRLADDLAGRRTETRTGHRALLRHLPFLARLLGKEG